MTVVLVALQLDERVERFLETTRVARREAECIAAVHEDARLGPHEIGGSRVRRDEVIVESDAEGVEAFFPCPYLADPGPAHASLVVGVIAALHGRRLGLRGGERRPVRS